MTKKSDAPAIRFKGFSDAWEQRKLSEITDKVTEKNAGLQYVETFTNSAEFGIISQRDFFDHDIAKLGSLDGYYIVKNEDFVYNPRISTSAPVGPINRNKLGRTGVMSPLYTVFRPHDIDTTYLEYFFKCGYWHSFMNFNGDSGARSDRFSIRDNVFFQMPIPIPDIDEQRKIGELLTCLDNLITLHQRQPFLQSPPDISLIVQLTPPFYTFSWEQRKLASLCEKFTDGDWIESKDQSDFGVRLVQTGNVGVAEYLDKPNNKKWISEDTFDRLHCEEVLPGDILISRLPEPAGRACIVPLLGTKMITAVDCTIVRTAPDMSNKFLVQYLSSQAYFDDVNTCLAGGTRQRISRGNLANFNVPIPVKKSEQDAIGMFFGYLDNLITLHQRKFEKLTNVKKSMLEKMFPQNGSSYPEIRFKGFTDPWEQRKLSEMCGTFEYGLNAAAKEFDGKNKYIRITDIDDVSREFLLSDLSSPDICLDGMSKYLLSSGDVVFARTGASVGKTYIYRENDGIVYFAGFLIRAKVNQDNDAEFVFQSTLSPSYEKYIRITSQRSGQPGVNAQEYSEYDLFAPSKEEQQRIGHFLRGIDHLITLHQRELEKLQNIKKSMLEKMFV